MKPLTNEQKLKTQRAKEAKKPKTKRIGKIKDVNGVIPVYWNKNQDYIILRQKDFWDRVETIYINPKSIKQLISILKTAGI